MDNSAAGAANAESSAGSGGAGASSSAVTEQAGLSWPVLLLLLLIPVTGIAMYYYGFVKCT